MRGDEPGQLDTAENVLQCSPHAWGWTAAGVDVRTISEHLQSISESNELHEDSVIRKFRITPSDEKKHLTRSYNFDAIISVGYRVNSKRTTQFRQWATQILRHF